MSDLKTPLSRFFFFLTGAFAVVYSFYAAAYDLLASAIVFSLFGVGAVLLLVFFLYIPLSRFFALRQAERGNFQALENLSGADDPEVVRFKQIDYYYKNGRPDKAEALFQRHPGYLERYVCPEEVPLNPRTYYLLKRALFLNLYTEGLYLSQLIQSKLPPHNLLHHSCAICKIELLLTRQNIKRAEFYFDTLTEFLNQAGYSKKQFKVSGAVLNYIKGRINFEKGFYADAFKAFQNAVSVRTEDELAIKENSLFYIFQCYGILGKIAAMRRTFTELKRLVGRYKYPGTNKLKKLEEADRLQRFYLGSGEKKREEHDRYFTERQNSSEKRSDGSGKFNEKGINEA